MSSRFVAPLARLVAWGGPPHGEHGEHGEHRRDGAWDARQRYHRTLFLVIGFWAVVTCVAAAVDPVAALVLAAAGLAHVIVGYGIEQRRRRGGGGGGDGGGGGA